MARKNTLEALLDPEAPPMANYAAAFAANSDAAQAETKAEDEVRCRARRAVRHDVCNGCLPPPRRCRH